MEHHPLHVRKVKLSFGNFILRFFFTSVFKQGMTILTVTNGTVPGTKTKHITHYNLSMVEHACNPSTWVAEAKGSRVWGYTGICSKILSQKNTKMKKDKELERPESWDWWCQLPPSMHLDAINSTVAIWTDEPRWWWSQVKWECQRAASCNPGWNDDLAEIWMIS